MNILLAQQETTYYSQKPQYPGTPYKDFEVDTPWRVKSPSESIPFIFTINDANQNNCILNYLRLYKVINGMPDAQQFFEYDPNPNIAINTDRWEYIYDDNNPINLGYSEGDVIEVMAEIGFINSSSPQSFKKHLKIYVGNNSFPNFSGWFHGDTHYHSEFTNNLYEFGASINATAKATSAMGLDWIIITDHSCDFDSEGSLFNNLADSIQKYNTVSDCRLIRGEEVTLDNNDITNYDPLYPDDKLHLLVYLNKFIRGPENMVALTKDISLNLTKLSNSLSNVNTGLAYAAHPTSSLDPWYTLFTIGALKSWSEENYSTALTYPQFRACIPHPFVQNLLIM